MQSLACQTSGSGSGSGSLSLSLPPSLSLSAAFHLSFCVFGLTDRIGCMAINRNQKMRPVLLPAAILMLLGIKLLSTTQAWGRKPVKSSISSSC